LASSLALGYEQGPQRITLAYRRVQGEQPFDYMAFGDGRSSASMVLANSGGPQRYDGPVNEVAGMVLITTLLVLLSTPLFIQLLPRA
ncbi:OprD family outer membrane porin, partial [Pseudomonas aeruginosa]